MFSLFENMTYCRGEGLRSVTFCEWMRVTHLSKYRDILHGHWGSPLYIPFLSHCEFAINVIKEYSFCLTCCMVLMLCRNVTDSKRKIGIIGYKASKINLQCMDPTQIIAFWTTLTPGHVMSGCSTIHIWALFNYKVYLNIAKLRATSLWTMIEDRVFIINYREKRNSTSVCKSDSLHYSSFDRGHCFTHH